MRFTAKLQRSFLFMIMISSILLMQCNKQSVSLKETDPELQFEEAKKVFDKKDYYKAKMQFTVIVLNNPGHRIIEQAQFYLAESHYNLKEYIQAIAEFEKLIRSMPQSPFVDNARYKVGLCYYELSPGYALDQEYTHKAIMQFQMFLEEYPASEVRPEVEKKLNEARTKLAKKEYKSGELYRKMGYLSSAVISFETVTVDYYDTEYGDDAYYWKGICHSKLGEWGDAITAFRSLLNKYPESSLAVIAGKKLEDAVIKKDKESVNLDIQE